MGYSCILLNPASWKHSFGITSGISSKIFKKYESNITGIIGAGRSGPRSKKLELETLAAS
jgi:hypothetical protein